MALTNDEVATEEGGSTGDVAVSEDDATDWFWTLLPNPGTKGGNKITGVIQGG